MMDVGSIRKHQHRRDREAATLRHLGAISCRIPCTRGENMPRMHGGQHRKAS